MLLVATKSLRYFDVTCTLSDYYFKYLIHPSFNPCLLSPKQRLFVVWNSIPVLCLFIVPLQKEEIFSQLYSLVINPNVALRNSRQEEAIYVMKLIKYRNIQQINCFISTLFACFGSINPRNYLLFMCNKKQIKMNFKVLQWKLCLETFPPIRSTLLIVQDVSIFSILFSFHSFVSTNSC